MKTSPYYDKKKTPIREWDLLKIHSFDEIGPSGKCHKKHWMYKLVKFNSTAKHEHLEWIGEHLDGSNDWFPLAAIDRNKNKKLDVEIVQSHGDMCLKNEHNFVCEPYSGGGIGFATCTKCGERRSDW